MQTERSAITFEQVDDLGRITFNDPDTRNALSASMMNEALDVISRLSADRSVRALVLTGQGKGFCSGANLSPSPNGGLEDQGGSLGDAMRASLNPLVMAIVEAPFPVIAAVNGAAAGAGVGLALAADFLIASESMQLLLTFSRIGMGLDAGTSWFLAHHLGLRRATAVSLLVEPITATKALEWGLAHEIAPDDELVARSMAFGHQLASGPTLAYAAQKRQLRQGLEMSLVDALDSEAGVQDRLVLSSDLREGVAAFRERRAPNFGGS